MPGHGNIVHYSQGAPNNTVLDIVRPDAYVSLVCPHCGKSGTFSTVAVVSGEPPHVAWSRCPACNKGIVTNVDQVAPSPKIGEDIDGLPDDVASAYDEARRTAGNAAYTSCELMCRKILMHIAVDKGDDEGKSFVAYLDYLKDSGYITPPMMDWVDLIRKNGNDSTHRLQAASPERALSTLAFTTQLLRLVYEMEHKARQYVKPAAEQ